MSRPSQAAINRRNWKSRRWTAFFPYIDREGRERIGKGRKYVVRDVEVELFPISVLCGILHRHYRTIYRWEMDYGFPMATWGIREDTHTKRWYSRKQLIAIRTIYESYDRLRRESFAKLPQFIGAVNMIFGMIDFPAERKKENGPVLEDVKGVGGDGG